MGRLAGCSSACWIAGQYRHCRLRGRAVGQARAQAGTTAGGSPSGPYCLRAWRRGAGLCSCVVCWAATVVADRHWRAAAPVTGLPDGARPASWSASLWMRIWSSGIQPVPGPLGAGSSWSLDRAGSRAGRPRSSYPFSLLLARSLAAGGAGPGCVAAYRPRDSDAAARAPGGSGPGHRHRQAPLTE
jgi:hypothetical protein